MNMEKNVNSEDAKIIARGVRAGGVAEEEGRRGSESRGRRK